MSRADYNAIKVIINDIVGDTQQGHILLKAIKGYFSQKESIPIVTPSQEIKTGGFSVSTNPIEKIEMEEAMRKYTEKLKKENEKFRKANGKKVNTVNS